MLAFSPVGKNKDWIPRIWRFFPKQIHSRSFGLWYIEVSEDYPLSKDYSVP